MMKKLLCIVIALSLILSSGAVYAKNDKAKAVKGTKLEQLIKQLTNHLCKASERTNLIKELIEYKKKTKDYSSYLPAKDEDILKLTMPMIKQENIIIPVDIITKGMGAQLSYDGNANQVTIVKGGTKVVIDLGKKTISLNGKEYKTNVFKQNGNKKTVKLIKLIAELFQLEVHWDEKHGLVIVPSPETIVINDSITGTGYNQFSYVGNWSYGFQDGAYGDDNHWSKETGAYALIKFNGRKIRIYGANAPNCGIAAVSIDNGKENKVDYYAKEREDNVLIYESPTLSPGNHVLKIRVTGEKNKKATDYFVTIDRAVVVDPGTPDQTPPTPAPEPVETIYLNDNSTGTGSARFEYFGTWSYTNRNTLYMGDCHFSNSQDAYCNVLFYGKKIKLYGVKDVSNGIAAISIDGGAEVKVDTFSKDRQDSVLLYESPELSMGYHVLKVRVTGEKNASSLNYVIALDKAEILSPANTTNLALGKTAQASSQDDASRGAEKAVDGKKETCWYSQYADLQWISVDLGSAQNIARVKIYWDVAYGKSYYIQVSEDQNTWYNVFSTTTGDGNIDDITFTPVKARYVKLNLTERATQWGYAINELEVYGG